MSKTDKVIIQCPYCTERFPVTVYSGEKQNKIYKEDTAPLKVLQELCTESVMYRVGCIHCKTLIFIDLHYYIVCSPIIDRLKK